MSLHTWPLKSQQACANCFPAWPHTHLCADPSKQWPHGLQDPIWPERPYATHRNLVLPVLTLLGTTEYVAPLTAICGITCRIAEY